MTTRADYRARIRELLADVYTPFGINVWMSSPNRNLDGKSPIGLMSDGQGHLALAEAEILAGGDHNG